MKNYALRANICACLFAISMAPSYVAFADNVALQTASSSEVVREDREPEAATGIATKSALETQDYMLVTANPYASWTGKRIIESGGSAIDAAVAIQAMLGLVEPQSSGIGGGAFILYWDNINKRLSTIDGREVAPAKASSYTFVQNGKAMKWIDAVVGGKSVGVPGVLKALEMAHKEHGVLPWKDLFTDTIKTAKDGFVVSERLAKLLAMDVHPGLNNFVSTQNYFKPNGRVLQRGQTRDNALYAKTLSNIAEQGADYFYQGPLAQKIAEATRIATINPGNMETHDLNIYQAIKREPICGQYRDHKVCGMAPPSSGGINVYQILKMLEGYDLSQYEPTSPEFVHLFSQASALAYADRKTFIADSDFTKLPAVSLINLHYLSKRARQVKLDREMFEAEAGEPYLGASLGQDKSPELPSTSHFVIVDKQGNAVSMTTSIEFMFGSGIMVEGFLLNNQMTDFSLLPTEDNKQVLNRVEPRKRPRSSMSPTMVFNTKGELELLLGSPGGSRIISYVAQTVSAVLDHKMDIQEAINLPRVTNRNDYTALEKGTKAESLRAALEAKGHTIRIIDLNSGLHGIQISPDKLVGGADPRREGIAVGQ